ncbi:MAG: tyrosine-type recombinase/integrase [Candidatus Poribacteria bacterium]|nr:tyrosine-type recombinase/integrase [Candidatus Poribacteria bacterium]
MKGTRPLTNAEIRKVRDAFSGTYAQRNRGLFMLGVSIGGRVSELLALTVGDVWQNEQPVTDFQFDKNIVKGGETARTIPVNSDGRTAIEEIIAWHRAYFGVVHPDVPLFPSQKGNTAIKRQAVHKILNDVFAKAGLTGKLATHTLRKTFAQRLYQQCNDIYVVRELLGHKNVITTQAYIGINYVSAQDAVEAMSLTAEENPTDPLDDFEPETLVAKVIEFGYEVRLRMEK